MTSLSGIKSSKLLFGSVVLKGIALAFNHCVSGLLTEFVADEVAVTGKTVIVGEPRVVHDINKNVVIIKQLKLFISYPHFS